MLKLLLIISVVLSSAWVHAVKELLLNADFESTNNWSCNYCSASLSTDHFSGQHSLLISNRHSEVSSVRQKVNTSPLHRYAAHCYIKLVNTPHGKTYTTASLIQDSFKNGHVYHNTIAISTLQQVQFGWTEIGGDFMTDQGLIIFIFVAQYFNTISVCEWLFPNPASKGKTMKTCPGADTEISVGEWGSVLHIHKARDSSMTQIYIKVDRSVNFLIDACSLQEIPLNNNWLTEAESRINNTRKAPITIRLVGSTSHSSKYSVEFMQKKSAFPWGTAVKASLITGSSTNYQNFIYNNFNWAVIENALKWRQMERTKGHEKFDWVGALDVLLAHGIKVRGHNMFWGVSRHEPTWLYGLSSNQMITEIHRHISSMITHSKGKLMHWDVNNENLHGDFFEQHTGDPNITSEMFRWIHQLDPNVKLFLNDFGVINKPLETTAIRNQAQRLKRAGVPIYGIGVQGHFKSSDIDMTTLKFRLDKVAEAGLPIWITELSIKEKDDNKRAVALQHLLTMFYSHPAVEGVLFWGFWDQAMFEPQSALVTGPNMTVNAAGKMYQSLRNRTWRTNIHHSIGVSSPLHRKAFLGDYILNVRNNGHLIHQQNVTIDKTGKDIAIHLQNEHQVSHIAFG